jgi:aspartate/methionine/tyrosine aminotransferase
VSEQARFFSRRSAFERRTNRLEAAKAERLRDGHAALDLTRSNPTDVGLPRFERAVQALTQDAAHGYKPEPFGLRTAREAVSGWMALQGMTVTPERIVLTASTSEAYAYLFKLLCDPGDRVVVPAPSYPLLSQLAQLEGVELGAYTLHYDGEWHLPIEGMRAAVDARTRALVCVNPNNPTGSYLKRTELAGMASLGLPIISDEVFAPYPLVADPARAASVIECESTLVFSLHGLSKLAGLPQLKLAWLCIGGPEARVAEACARLELIADAFLSPGTPVQLALPEILATHHPFTHAIARRVERNLAWLREQVRETPADVLRVEGGWYAVVRLPATRDDEGWALHLLEHANVLVQPGYFYDFEPGPAYLVLSLIGPEGEFETGVTRLLRCVADPECGG